MEGRSHMGIGIALGMAIGAGLGVAMDNLSMGVALGLCFGVAIGAGMDQANKKKRSDRDGESGGASSERPDDPDRNADDGARGGS